MIDSPIAFVKRVGSSRRSLEAKKPHTGTYLVIRRVLLLANVVTVDHENPRMAWPHTVLAALALARCKAVLEDSVEYYVGKMAKSTGLRRTEKTMDRKA